MSNANINDFSIRYVGKVDIKIKLRNGSVVNINNHNNGTMLLSKAFARFISGDSKSLSYKPQYLDLQYCPVNSAEEVYRTFLKQLVPITAPKWTYEANAYQIKGTSEWLNNWVATVSASIPYNILSTAISSDTEDRFRLYLLTGTISGEIETRLAFVDISASELSQMEPGTEALVSWKLQLVHNDIEEE